MGKNYLVNEILPDVGMNLSVDDYVMKVIELGGSRRQALGGSSRWKTVLIVDGMIYRTA